MRKEWGSFSIGTSSSFCRKGLAESGGYVGAFVSYVCFNAEITAGMNSIIGSSFFIFVSCLFKRSIDRRTLLHPLRSDIGSGGTAYMIQGSEIKCPLCKLPIRECICCPE
jgi:hypothetical protein